MHFHRIAPEEILVAHDELDLPPGSPASRSRGAGPGGNGVKDVQRASAAPNSWRLRLGIGHPGDRDEVVNHVLKPPRKE